MKVPSALLGQKGAEGGSHSHEVLKMAGVTIHARIGFRQSIQDCIG